jgi:putative PepSY-like beta-lactamase-inhibitor
MRGIAKWVNVGVVACFVAIALSARADDKAQKIEPDKLPQKIKDAVKARLPGAEITSAEKEKENGEIVYDLELKHEGRKYEMDIKEDGTIIEIEKEIKNPPEAITKAVKRKYPKATIKEVMEVNKVTGKEEKPEKYEVTIEIDGKMKEVIVSLDGKSVKEGGEEKKEK